MAGNFDFLHIKRRTAGSSNELSLDVLDQKSAEADNKAARSAKLPKSLKPSRGSYAGVGASSTLTGQDEVAKRKKARRARRVRIRVFVGATLSVFVAIGAFAAIRFHEEHVDIASRSHVLVDRLAAVDETLMEIDVLMGDPLDSEQAGQRAHARERMTALATELNRIEVDAQSLLAIPMDQETQVAVEQIDKSARARTSMVAAARDAFDLSEESTRQVDGANRLWGEVLNINQRGNEAVLESGRASTPEDLAASLAATRESLAAMADTRERIRSFSSSAGVDVAAQAAYLEKKIEALEWAVATDEAILAKDRDRAAHANEAYNAADTEAARMAADLPPSMAGTVRVRFEELMKIPIEKYGKARQDVVESDAVIREYLRR